jgi:hypothetical protein
MAQGNIGVLFNTLRGKAGSVVFARSKDGTVIRPRISGENPRTPAQLAVRDALSKAAKQYAVLTTVQVKQWFKYAQSITKHDPRTGKTYRPEAITAFTALASKFYQVTPAGTAPATPPATPFSGDTKTVTASAGTPGQIDFVASGANGTNISTELLLQPLVSQNRKPQQNGYRSKEYFHFAPGGLTESIAVEPGWYAPAYRFVKTTTGQEAGFTALPVVQVT